MSKQRARINEANNPVPETKTDQYFNTVELVGNTTRQQDINITSHKDSDVMQKATFQIRRSILNRLKQTQANLLSKLGDDTPDREVIVEEAVVQLLERLESDSSDEVISAFVSRQKTREEELERGVLIRVGVKSKK